MKKLYLPVIVFLSCLVCRAQTTVSVVADRDNSIFSVFPGTSNGAGQYFFVGRNSPTNSSSVQRALLHFDLSSITPGSVVTSATLTIYVNKSAAAASGIELHKATANWGEGTSDAAGNEGPGATATTNDATWLMRFYPSTSWTASGGDFSATVSASAAITSGLRAATAVNFTGSNVAADVQSWINSAATNFGWLIKADNETTDQTAKRFISKNSPTIAQRPTLSITYTAAMPVTLTDFSASANRQDALLKWETATETNNKSFVVEHSRDAVNFEAIGTLNGNGTSTLAHSYTFTHNNIDAGKHFYRLIQVDFDGTKHYSQVISLMSGSSSTLQVFPNPAKTSIFITSSSMLQGADFTISSYVGQVVKKGFINNQQIDVQMLAPGQYWLTTKTANGELLKAGFIKR